MTDVYNRGTFDRNAIQDPPKGYIDDASNDLFRFLGSFWKQIHTGLPFVKGVQLVRDTLLKSLKDHGAEPFDSVGKPLDTEKMEAIATLPSDEIEEGKVSIESKKGWMLKDKVLRVAQVVVSSGKKG